MKKIFSIAILLMLVPITLLADRISPCVALLDVDAGKIPRELWFYQNTNNLMMRPTRNFADFAPMQAIFVTHRDNQGRPTDGFIRVLVDNPHSTVEVVGEFNNWGLNGGGVRLRPDVDPRYMVGDLHGISHGMQYRLLVNGQQLLDPAALTLSSPDFNARVGRAPEPYLNSVFWDVAGVAHYDFKYPRVPVGLKGGTKFSENDPYTLTAKWPYEGHLGPRALNQTFSFIADSGVVQKLRSMNNNAVEFLPLTASVDGLTWAYRYLSYSMFAIDSRWGTLTEFQRMVDEFHRNGMSVVLDIVPAHYPRNGNLGDRSVGPVGQHNFRKADGHALYGDENTMWDTNYYDFQNPYVRRYLKDAILNLIKFGNIDGIRIDHAIGIMGKPGGAQFLRELEAEIRSYVPTFYINFESFGGDNTIAKFSDWGGYGATNFNNGNFFFNFVKHNLQSRTEDIDLTPFINDLKDSRTWNELAKLFYVTNHDESANGQGGATGAYPASLIGGDWIYKKGKSLVFSADAMFAGSFYLDMPQLALGQEGTYYTNPAADWSSENDGRRRQLLDLESEMAGYYVNNAAFAFHNSIQDTDNHWDNTNKVLTLKRMDLQTGKVIYILINHAHYGLENYRFGVFESGSFRIAFDSDNEKFGGSSRLGRETHGVLQSENWGEHGKPHSLKVSYMAPYSVTIFEK